MDIWRETFSYAAPILTLFGGIATVGTAIAVTAYGMVKLFGEKWLQAKFDERLAALKHEQQKELEGLKFKISRRIDRAIKFHQREFEVLPEAWAQLSELFTRTIDFVLLSPNQPNLDEMLPEHLEDFISHCELRNWQKDKLRQSSNKNEYYIKNIFWYRLTNIKELQQNCYLYILKNSIIMPKDIRDKFIQIERLISPAIKQNEINHTDPPHPQMFDDIKKLSKDGDLLIDELEKAIENRLVSLENIEF